MTHPRTHCSSATAPVATNGAVATPMKFSTNFPRTSLRQRPVRDDDVSLTCTKRDLREYIEGKTVRDESLSAQRTAQFLRRTQETEVFLRRAFLSSTFWRGASTYRKAIEPRSEVHPALETRITNVFYRLIYRVVNNGA